MDTCDNMLIVKALGEFFSEVKENYSSATPNYQVVEKLQTTLKRFGYKISKED